MLKPPSASLWAACAATKLSFEMTTGDLQLALEEQHESEFGSNAWIKSLGNTHAQV